MKNLLLGVLLYFFGQLFVWFQTNGQFIWPWAKKNPLLIALTCGGITTYMFILGTKYVAEYYDGLIWPGRFIGFSTGVVIFAFLTYWMLGEGINLKTSVSLMLALALIMIQIFWK